MNLDLDMAVSKAHESQAVEADKNRTGGKWWGIFKGAGFGYLEIFGCLYSILYGNISTI